MKSDREQPVRIVKVRKGHHAHHGGAWKVAFADFMTAMMALFLVLWLVTQSSDVRSAIAGYFQDPLGRATEFGSSIIKGDGAQAAHLRPIMQPEITEARRDRLMQLGQQVRRAIASSVDLQELADHVTVELVDEGLRISLHEDSSAVFFETGSAQPRANGVRLLTAIGGLLGEVPYPVQVEGHTDARPYAGSGAYGNWELSADRANAARRLLVSGGLPVRQVASVLGLADREPATPDPFAPTNRRVTILIRLPLAPVAPPVASGGP